MDGCDARHNEELLLCTIDRFVMAITAAEVVAWPALVSSSTAQLLPCGKRQSIRAPLAKDRRSTSSVSAPLANAINLCRKCNSGVAPRRVG
jgi:hypothetical protein